MQHNLSPPRYSSPPPLPRTSTENPYDYPLEGPRSLLSNKSFSHAPSPSIVSAYSRPLSHSHNHPSVTAPFAYQTPIDSNRNSHTEHTYVQLPYSEIPGQSLTRISQGVESRNLLSERANWNYSACFLIKMKTAKNYEC